MSKSPLLPSATLILVAASLCACGAAEEPGTGEQPAGSGTVPVGTTPMTTGTDGTTVPPSTVPPSDVAGPGSSQPMPPGTPMGTVPTPGVSTPVPGSSTPPSVSPVPDPSGGPTPVNVPNPEPTPEPGVTPEPVDPGPAPAGNCTFQVDYDLSEAIGTVGIVNWSVTGITPTEARIDFSLVEGGWDLSAPVDLSEPNYRTLLLGMKEDSDYTFHVVASDGTTECQSETFELTTDPAPNMVTRPNPEIMNPGAQSKGFIVTTAGLGSLGGAPGGGGGGGTPMFVFDTDGDIVWWADAPPSSGRALLDWEGKNMYVATLNYPQMGGQVRRISMDGMDTEIIDELSDVHHDFTVTPQGLALIMYEGSCSGVFRYSPESGVSPIVSSVATLYQPTGGFGGGGDGECHPNAITYQAEDDTFVISDRNPNLFVRITSSGELLWQFGGSNPLGNHIEGSWNVNHGHHLLPDGTFLLFNNGNGNPSPVLGFSLNTDSWQATQVWDFTLQGAGSATLGDVQRLENGNTLITYSNGGTLVEVDPDKNIVARFTAGSLGYSLFRETLYGPPPK